nr:immunoglobulin heavy chain junction region [Macaca mulatta]MOX64370.1 immunoglobulin heavy chain junction region [Macaca mulatta]MOX65074.1 immunoglobulin heavy chain junction region [Macaca mulatta]MOX66022.1 immunoglobulin heavy chain junction region [Macaca mulatta]
CARYEDDSGYYYFDSW